MRTLLATLLLAPALAAAQAPPPAVRQPYRPQPPSARAVGEAAPTAPQPAAPPPAAAPPPRAAPGPAPAAAAPAEAGLTPVKADAKCTPIQGRFMLAFSKTEIVDLLEQASRWTCRNFIYGEDVAKGKITLLSKTPVTAEEAYAAFLSALNSNGIALYQTGRYWKLIRTGDAKKTPIPTYTTDGGETPSSEQPITRLIRLQYSDADQMRGIMGNFISPQGADLQAIPPDLLIITDAGINIRRIEKLIEAIDRPGSGESVRLLQVRFAPAKDIAEKINQIFGASAGGAPGKPGRRPLISTRPAPAAGTPAVPGAPPAGGGAAESQVAVQLTKVIPDDRTNKLIIITDDKSFERIVELVQQLDVPTAEGGGIHVVYLKNATAEDLAQTLSNLAQGKSGKSAPGVPASLPGQPARPATPAVPGQAAATSAELFSGEVKITADKAQNALVVQASGADIATVRKLVEKLDRPRRQVFVEAVIMEVDLRNEFAFGVGMHGAAPVNGKNGTGFVPLVSSPGRISSVGPLGNVQSLVSLGGFLTGYAGPVSASLKELGLNLPSIGVMIQALQSDSDVNVISTPQLLASDNEESEIAVGQNVPFKTGYAPGNLAGLAGGTGAGTGAALGTAAAIGGLNSLYAPIQRQPVELRLKIKPQISEGDNIRLQIDEQIEEIVSQDAELGPTTAKRSVKTQIVARDQSTIVIGGLIQERAVRSVKKVPFLGSIPVLGWLFRDTTTIKQKTNLLLFLTPYIIRDEADYRRIYEKKRKEQQDFIEAFYGRQPGYDVAIDFSRKAGPYSRMRRDVAEETSRIENGGGGGPNDRLVTPAGVVPVGQAAPAPVPVPVPPPAPLPGAEPIEPQPELPPLAPPGPPPAPAATAPAPPGAPPQERKP